MKPWLKPPAMLLAVVALPAVLAGCRAEEQGRITSYEKGVYLGAPDEEIDDATREKLKQRARLQGF